MMHVLIIDDDVSKTEQIRNVVMRGAGSFGAVVEVAKNAYDGGRAMAVRTFDVLILDIKLPLRDGEEARPDGGVKVLESLRSATPPRLPSHIVGLTAYDDLLSQYAPQFGEELWAVVHFDPSFSDWETALSRHIAYIASALERATADYDIDVGIITALHKVELEAVLALNGHWAETRKAGDDAIYHEGRFEHGDRSVRVVAAAAVEMGMCAAATLSMNLISHFRPRLLAMVGVAAGVKGAPGDILVAEQSWDYGSGKSTEDGAGKELFLPAPSAIPLSQALRHKIHWFAIRPGVLERVQSAWIGEQRSEKLNVQIGPVASGAAVLANRAKIESIIEHNRKVIGVEMEIYGVYQAARTCWGPKPDPIAIKSICDFGSGEKSDQFKSYAAFSSARYLYEFVLHGWR